MKSTLTILQLPSSTTRPRLRPYGRVKPLLVITAMLAASAITMIDAGKAWGQFLTQGTATPSERCGVCHQETYREFATGFGSDLEYPPMILGSLTNDVLTLPTTISGSATAHAYAGVDPWPIQARVVENNGQSCNVCHFPQPLALPDMDVLSVPKPIARGTNEEAVGITCASCHMTPEGTIRATHLVDPFWASFHGLVQDPALQTSVMCAYCHSVGARVIGKQTQTFLEWREDFYKPGLGSQHCQDCHMPRTLRKVAEPFDFPVRPVARHLWTGSHSMQRLTSALNLTVVQPTNGPGIEFHVINFGAGHSFPTGSNRRAIYLQAEVLDPAGTVLTNREWMFAPWYGDRPDDKAFLDADRSRPDAIAAMQADAQGPHETIIRAGEDRVLSWAPAVSAGAYTIQATLIHDWNRYNDRAFREDQREIARAYLSVGSVPLSVTQSGGSVTVSWPPSFTGFLLEETDSLSASAKWRQALGVVGNSVTMDRPTGAKFYRLRKL